MFQFDYITFLCSGKSNESIDKIYGYGIIQTG